MQLDNRSLEHIVPGAGVCIVVGRQGRGKSTLLVNMIWTKTRSCQNKKFVDPADNVLSNDDFPLRTLVRDSGNDIGIVEDVLVRLLDPCPSVVTAARDESVLQGTTWHIRGASIFECGQEGSRTKFHNDERCGLILQTLFHRGHAALVQLISEYASDLVRPSLLVVDGAFPHPDLMSLCKSALSENRLALVTMQSMHGFDQSSTDIIDVANAVFFAPSVVFRECRDMYDLCKNGGPWKTFEDFMADNYALIAAPEHHRRPWWMVAERKESKPCPEEKEPAQAADSKTQRSQVCWNVFRCQTARTATEFDDMFKQPAWRTQLREIIHAPRPPSDWKVTLEQMRQSMRVAEHCKRNSDWIKARQEQGHQETVDLDEERPLAQTTSILEPHRNWTDSCFDRAAPYDDSCLAFDQMSGMETYGSDWLTESMASAFACCRPATCTMGDEQFESFDDM